MAKLARRQHGRSRLHGPVCPRCGKSFVRRHVWFTWDQARCGKCGAIAECVLPSDDGEAVWIFSYPPDTRPFTRIIRRTVRRA